MTKAGPKPCKKQSSCREYPFYPNKSCWNGQNSSFHSHDRGSLLSTNGKQLYLFREGINTLSESLWTAGSKSLEVELGLDQMMGCQRNWKTDTHE